MAEGLPQITSMASGTTKTLEKGVKNIGSVSGKASISIASVSSEQSGELSNTSGEGQKREQVINTILDDYAVEQLITRLEKNDLFSKSPNTDGSIILQKTNFNMYDFEQIHSTFGLVDGQNPFDSFGFEKNDLENWQSFRSFASLFKQLFPNTTIFSIMNGVVFAENHRLRMSNPQLSMLQNSTRDVTVLGIVESTVNSNYLDSEGADIFGDRALQKIGDISSFFQVKALANANLIKKGDRFIKPIAIYFD